MWNIGQPSKARKNFIRGCSVEEKDAKRAFELAGAKLPMNTTFVKRGTNG